MGWKTERRAYWRTWSLHAIPSFIVGFVLNKPPFLIAGGLIFAGFLTAGLRADSSDAIEQIPAGVKGNHGNPPIRIEQNEVLITKDSFRPPIEITIVAETDSTNLRISYTADQVIFNWEGNESQLRVDGGPAGGKHKMNGGLIPVDKYVTIRWDVTPTQESIYVDGDLRFHNTDDYSKIDKPISVFGFKSILKVMSLTTRTLQGADAR
jgi:hypothetical protein